MNDPSNLIRCLGLSGLVAVGMSLALACSHGNSQGIPSELSAVSSHLALISEIQSPDGKQTITNYKVDEPFDAFLEQFKPQMQAGGWNSLMDVQQLSGTGDRDIQFDKVVADGDAGDVSIKDEYKLSDSVGSTVDPKQAKNVMLYHFAPIKK